MKIEHLLAADVEREPSDFAFHLLLIRDVRVIFGTGCHKFANEIVFSFHFVGEIAQVIAKGHVGLSRFPRVDDRVRVKVQDALIQQFEGFVQFEACVTLGKAGNEHVHVGLNGIAFVHVRMKHLDHVIVDHFDAMNGLTVILQQFEEGTGLREGRDLRLIGSLTVFAPV